jgi:hypothetical protein
VIGALTLVAVLCVAMATSSLPASAGQMHTGLRAAAIKKCKRKYPPGPRRHHCLIKASHQPQ